MASAQPPPPSQFPKLSMTLGETNFPWLSVIFQKNLFFHNFPGFPWPLEPQVLSRIKEKWCNPMNILTSTHTGSELCLPAHAESLTPEAVGLTGLPPGLYRSPPTITKYKENKKMKEYTQMIKRNIHFLHTLGLEVSLPLLLFSKTYSLQHLPQWGQMFSDLLLKSPSRICEICHDTHMPIMSERWMMYYNNSLEAHILCVIFNRWLPKVDSQFPFLGFSVSLYFKISSPQYWNIS